MFKGKFNEISTITKRLLMSVTSDLFSVFYFVWVFKYNCPLVRPCPRLRSGHPDPWGHRPYSASGSHGFHCKVNKIILTTNVCSAVPLREGLVRFVRSKCGRFGCRGRGPRGRAGRAGGQASGWTGPAVGSLTLGSRVHQAPGGDRGLARSGEERLVSVVEN